MSFALVVLVICLHSYWCYLVLSGTYDFVEFKYDSGNDKWEMTDSHDKTQRITYCGSGGRGKFLAYSWKKRHHSVRGLKPVKGGRKIKFRLLKG